MDKRLMNLKEFQVYMGGIGRNTALKLIDTAEARVKIGRRLLVDKTKIDQWIDANRK